MKIAIVQTVIKGAVTNQVFFGNIEDALFNIREIYMNCTGVLIPKYYKGTSELYEFEVQETGVVYRIARAQLN